MARVKLLPQKAMNHVISHEDGVKGAVFREAHEIRSRADLNLQRHRYRRNVTDHEVSVTKGDVDSFTNLEGPAPGAIEFGHWLSGSALERADRIKWVRGLYILTGAAGILD